MADGHDDDRSERSRQYSGDLFPTSSSRHPDSGSSFPVSFERSRQVMPATEDRTSFTQAMMQYDGIANRGAGSSTRSASAQSSSTASVQSVRSHASSRVGIAQLVDGPIHLPSVPEIPAVGSSQHVMEASGPILSSFTFDPQAGARQPPPPSGQGRRTSFIDEIFSPSHRSGPNDMGEETEAFWMEGRALDEAVMRFGKDGAK